MSFPSALIKETLRSYTASRHYDDYAIADPSANVDGRRGLRLREPGVQVLEVLQTPPGICCR